MNIKLPQLFSRFLDCTSVGIIDEAIISLRPDSITADVLNRESTLIVYSSIRTDACKDYGFPQVDVKDKNGNVIGNELRLDIGVMNIPLLTKSFNSLELDEGKIQAEISEESIILSDKDSKYRILLGHPDVIKKPGKIKQQEYPVVFEMTPGRVNALLKGMSNIENAEFSIEQNDEKCTLKVGVDITNNYIETVKNESPISAPYKKFFNKEHIEAVLNTHKGKNILFQAMEKILCISADDEKVGVITQYYLSPKKSIEI